MTDNRYGYNYTAVAPVLDEHGQAIAEIQYILDMQSVRDHLNSFLRNMLIISLLIITIALLIYMLGIEKIVIRPVKKSGSPAHGSCNGSASCLFRWCGYAAKPDGLPPKWDASHG